MKDTIILPLVLLGLVYSVFTAELEIIKMGNDTRNLILGIGKAKDAEPISQANAIILRDNDLKPYQQAGILFNLMFALFVLVIPVFLGNDPNIKYDSLLKIYWKKETIPCLGVFALFVYIAVQDYYAGNRDMVAIENAINKLK